MRFLRRLLGSLPSQEPREFGDFLHRQGAFVAQKTVLDYCRVKIGRNEKAFFGNADFQAALNHCRWQVFLAAQSDVVALAEAWLRPFCPGREAFLLEQLVALHADFMAQEAPPAEEQEAFAASLTALPGHLAGLQLAAPHDARTLPLLAEAPLFATLPIHPDQRKGEGPAIRGALRFHMVSCQQEMERAFDPAGLSARLIAGSDTAT
ncbi:MAG: hypothetical protein INF75_14305 [Roseomonas sp.]|nr:hypothetical protein [Roseomonas sp.]MCA3326402.1 hypothetical protein [Roseomonas sp.]MCA3331531.1 hypothetical protein [Roseomonas sp.]MCA3336426.1 hypothetical protein [Roseomonas sp.]MCA3347858.1 hypothetical protein [Roseomonas sp.]